jgi:hypothetical protein
LVAWVHLGFKVFTLLDARKLIENRIKTAEFYQSGFPQLNRPNSRHEEDVKLTPRHGGISRGVGKRDIPRA